MDSKFSRRTPWDILSAQFLLRYRRTGCWARFRSQHRLPMHAWQFSAVMDSGQKIEVSIPGGELKRFVSLLVELLPGGKYKSAASEAATLIPHCQPQLDDEFKPLLQKALKRAREQIKETAAEHAKWRREAEEMRSINVIAAQAKQDAANSIEPVFITCVRSLLDEIRSYYAC